MVTKSSATHPKYTSAGFHLSINYGYIHIEYSYTEKN